MPDRKKRVLLHTDFSLSKTGFGRVAKELLNYLYSTNKYELMNYCCGIPENAPPLSLTPWLSEGAIPADPQTQQQMQADPNFGRAASYGASRIDAVVASFKPDVGIFCQDFWGVDFTIDKLWFNKITSAIWTTLDSLPLLESAVASAPKIKNYLMWADFATQAMHQKGHTHVKTVHGPLNTNQFFRLPDEKRKELRKKFNIPEDSFIGIFNSRNQLRKLYPNVLQGYKLFKDRNPEIKNTFLIFHCFLGEGWRIDKLCKEYGVNPKEVLVTYICRNCGEYEVKSFDDRSTPHEIDEKGCPKIDSNGKFIEKSIQLHDKDCKYCGAQKAQITTNVGLGVTTEQLNEIYNLADYAINAFTSGGQELTIFEAKLAELITCVSDYSCGKDALVNDAYSLPLEGHFYFEHGTEFLKLSVSPSSIAKQMLRIYKMSPPDRKKWGAGARKWVEENYDIKVIGKWFEEFIDSAPFVDENDPKNFLPGEEKQWNPNAQIPTTNSDEEFVIKCYHEILDSKDVAPGHPDLNGWVQRLKEGMPRQHLEQTFRNIAAQELQKKNVVSIEDILEKNGKKRFLILLKDSAGDIFNASALFDSWRDNHPEEDWDLYFCCDPIYFPLLEGNPHIKKLIPYQQIFESELVCTGQGNNKGFFDGYCHLAALSQRVLSYLTNQNIGLELKG